MRTIYPIAILATQADVDSGLLNNVVSQFIIVVGSDGIPITPTKIYTSKGDGTSLSQIATQASVQSAVASIVINDWTASTAITLNEVRRATVAVGGFDVGDLIRSNSARTTRASFDVTEAGNWTGFSIDLVRSVASRTGDVVLTNTDVGLGNVNNTADTAKPVSTAQQTALDLKANLASPAFTGAVAGITKTMVGLGNVDNTTDLLKPISTATQTALNLKADNTDLTDSTINAAFRTVLTTAVQSLASGTDVNGLTGNGWYNVQNPINGPTSTNWFYIENIIHRTITGDAPDPNYKFQRAILLTDTGNKEYTRMRIAGTWTSWIEIANLVDIPAFSVTNPVMDGTAVVGTATTTTRSDHVHPSDTSRFPQITSGTIDANNTALVDNTIYHGNNTGVITNGPTSAWAWSLFNLRHGTWRTQVVYTSGNVYSRQQNTTFTGANWTQFAATTSLTDGSVSAQFDELRFDRVRPLTGTDLNVLTVSGFYDGSALTNAPGGSADWFYIEHLQHNNAGDPNWRMQKAYGLGSPNSGFSAAGTMYVRTMVNGVWQAWRTVTTTAT